jgi:MotA/TolQ/ExbB proton channel family
MIPGLKRARAPSRSLPKSAAAHTDRVFWMWALAAITLCFFYAWLWRTGWWTKLIVADPSGVSLGVAALTLVLTGWIGWRAWRLRTEALIDSAWRLQFAQWQHADPQRAPELLTEISHGPHETAWWLAGATIKLGMLGTVIGFIVMSSSIAASPSFDFDQVQNLLKLMTQGMAIALYTTLVGLVANLWLGLLLLVLDRTADYLAADIVAGKAAHLSVEG